MVGPPDFRQRLRQALPGTKHAGAPPRWVGLDLGSQSLKLAEVELTPSGSVRLVKSLIQELPAAQDHAAVDRVGWLQSALKEFSAREVHVSLSGTRVAIRRLHMPLMSKKELPEAVKWELRDYVPFPIQESVFAFHVLGEVWEKDIKKLDILAVAAATSYVDEVIAMVERAGVRVASLVPTHLAMWRCVTSLIPEAKQGSVAVIELGNAETKVAIAKDGEIRIVRDVAVGGESLTKSLIGVVASETGEIAIDHSKAEALKRRYGILREPGEGTTDEGVPLFHLASLMRPILEDMLTEIGRLFDFYKVQMEESGVTRVLLGGAGANLKQLQPFLADGLGMTVEIFNPLIRITDRAQSMEPEQVAESGPRLAVALGLALDHGQLLTLVPPEVRQTRVAAASRRISLTAVKGAAALAAVVYVGLQLVSWWLHGQVRAQEGAWAALQPAYAHYMSVTSETKTLETAMADVQRFEEQQPLWEGIFKEIGELIPPGIELDALTVATDEAHPSAGMSVRLKGRLAAQDAGAQGSIAQFADALEHSPFFIHVELTSSETRTADAGTSSFELEGHLE